MVSVVQTVFVSLYCIIFQGACLTVPFSNCLYDEKFAQYAKCPNSNSDENCSVFSPNPAQVWTYNSDPKSCRAWCEENPSTGYFGHSMEGDKCFCNYHNRYSSSVGCHSGSLMSNEDEKPEKICVFVPAV